MSFNDLDLYNNKINKRINRDIYLTLKENNFIFGRSVLKFEKQLSKFVGSKYAVSVGSGTDALLLSLLSLQLKKNDEIIIPSFSWLSVLEVVLLLNLKPIFVDTDTKTFNFDNSKIENLISKRTKVIISTSLFGMSADLIRLKKICKRKGLTLIEDAAQNFGSKIGKYSACNIADLTCTSFFPSKNLGAYGDGGAIFTNKKKYFDKLVMLRNHGQDKYNESKLVGINSRLGSLQASILIKKLRDIKKKKVRHQKLYLNYSNFFKKNQIEGFSYPRQKNLYDDMNSQFSILVKNRNLFIKNLKKYNIDYKIYYAKPLYKQFNLNNKIFLKNTEFVCKSIISLPFNDFSKSRFKKVLVKLKKIISKERGIFFEKK